ncbi:peptidoglycan recognition protein I-beta [Streptomyces clavuligerus]|nr:peptidoglycan recognition protein I-beta [Streptomyces clavuligerus]
MSGGGTPAYAAPADPGALAKPGGLTAPPPRYGASTRSIQIISRHTWGAQPPKRPYDAHSWQPWNGGAAIHHLGNGSVPSADHTTDCFQQVREVQNIAFRDPEMVDIAYNYLVCQHGGIFEGRGPSVRSAANGDETTGANQDYFAICGLLRLDDHPSLQMRYGIRDLIGFLRSTHSAGPRIRGHRDLYRTECPGNLYQSVGNGDLEPGNEGTPGGSELVIHARYRWGARPPRTVARVPWTSRTGFTVHYSAGPPTQTPRQIQNYHMDSRGWDDIGYNFLVDRDGRIYEGRGWTVEGAHATGHNTSHIGVCFIGGDGDAGPRVATAVRGLYTRACELAGRSLARTWHGGLPGQSTSCPGSALRAWVQGGMQGDDLPVRDDSGGGSGGGGGGGMTSVRSVAAQQRAVNDLGHMPKLVVDGVWGPLTDGGVRWLQQRVGVAADGLWGPATEQAYAAYTGGGSGGGGGGGMTSVRSVAAQQRAVNDLGRTPQLAVDGVWGPSTDAGVRWLQQRVGVAADGLWGPATEAAYHAWLDEGARLAVDGVFGQATVAAVQRAVGVPADGVWGPDSIRGLQRHLNTWGGASLTVDGAMGPGTVRALQTHLNRMAAAGLTVDGLWGPATVRAVQNGLNLGRF